MRAVAPLEICNLSKVSVVTIVFNDHGEIAKTIRSVLFQDYPNIEYIVIDGNSTDGTKEVIQQYKEKISIFLSEPDDGVYDAMNKGISQSSGEFIIFMNCGDSFVSSNCISTAMTFAQKGVDQILFGHWLRQVKNSTMACFPEIEKGLFNHQAVIYSRSIHAWHGGYVSVKGFTTADYLFFATLFKSSKVTCKVIDVTIAVIDVNGLSAGPQTLSQKYAIDYLCGRVSKVRLLVILAGHPLYLRAKALLRWMR